MYFNKYINCVKILSFLTKIWKLIIEIFFPAYCINCKREGSFLCNLCFKTLNIQQCQFCPHCNIISPNGTVCESCNRQQNHSLDGLISCLDYDKSPLLKKIIHTYKYDFVEDLAPPLSTLLFHPLKSFLKTYSSFCICPVPLHRKRIAWRGFNQCELLSKNVSESLGIDSLNLLNRVHFSKPQMELSRDMRLLNTNNAFTINHSSIRILKKNGFNCVVLVDDVATTCSTLESCAKILKQNGVKSVYGIVLARVY